MTSKIFLTLGTSAIVFGMLGLQGCFVVEEPRHVAPAYGYPAYDYPAYGYAAPAPPVLVYGDYDEHHAWHERNWWVNSRRDWVKEHHPDWLASKERHGDREEHEHH